MIYSVPLRTRSSWKRGWKCVEDGRPWFMSGLRIASWRTTSSTSWSMSWVLLLSVHCRGLLRIRRTCFLIVHSIVFQTWRILPRPSIGHLIVVGLEGVTIHQQEPNTSSYNWANTGCTWWVDCFFRGSSAPGLKPDQHGGSFGNFRSHYENISPCSCWICLQFRPTRVD